MDSILTQIFARLGSFSLVVCLALATGLAIYALLPATLSADQVIKPKQQRGLKDTRGEHFWTTLPSRYGYGIKTKLKSVFNTGALVQKGYDEFSTQDQIFGFTSLGSGRLAILPPSAIHILNKPKDQISARLEQWQILQPLYTIGATEHAFSTMFKASTNVAWKSLPRLYSAFAPINDEETGIALRKFWGQPDEWTKVNLFTSCCDIMTRVSMRAVLGEELCRSDRFVDICQRFSVAVFAYAGLISTFPRGLQPILGPIIGYPARRVFCSLRRELEPVVRQRLRESQIQPTDATRSDDEKGSGRQLDILDWMVKEGHKSQPAFLEEYNLTLALAILIMQSSFSMGYALTNCVLDVYSSENHEEIVEELRKEVDPISAEFSGFRSKEAVGSLLRVDSCIRESLRFSGFSVIQPIRLTTANINLNGQNIPPGIRLGVPIQAIHHDPRYYPNPAEFNPFRSLQTTSLDNDVQKIQPSKQELSTDASAKFLMYGFGRHACPGRFFASQMLQVALARIVRDYDIQRIPSRPLEQPLLNILRPPTGFVVQIRRRGSKEGITY